MWCGYWKPGTANQFQTKACKNWFEHGRILRQAISEKVLVVVVAAARGKNTVEFRRGPWFRLPAVEEVKFMAASLQHSSAAAHKLQSCIGTCGEGWHPKQAQPEAEQTPEQDCLEMRAGRASRLLAGWNWSSSSSFHGQLKIKQRASSSFIFPPFNFHLFSAWRDVHTGMPGRDSNLHTCYYKRFYY